MNPEEQIKMTVTGKIEEAISGYTVTITTHSTLTEEHIIALQKVKEKGYWEFRDHDSDWCRQKILKESICRDLQKLGLMDDGDMSWHVTFYLTELGSQVIDSMQFEKIKKISDLYS